MWQIEGTDVGLDPATALCALQHRVYCEDFESLLTFEREEPRKWRCTMDGCRIFRIF